MTPTPPTLDEVREILVDAAIAGQPITYTAIYGDRYVAHGRASSDLGKIALAEHMAGRPLLSVIAVSAQTGRPSDGLYKLAIEHDRGETKCQCGVPLVKPGEDDKAFCARQLELIAQTWTPPDPLGGPFRPLPGRGPDTPPMELRIDLDALEKGTKRHEATRNALAAFLTAAGLEPHEHGGDAAYDLGWLGRDGDLWIAEVKSLRQTTETQQLRLGLGQLLEYRQRCQRPGRVVRATLVVEQHPADLRWVAICDAVGVVLAWPERFEAVFA